MIDSLARFKTLSTVSAPAKSAYTAPMLSDPKPLSGPSEIFESRPAESTGIVSATQMSQATSGPQRLEDDGVQEQQVAAQESTDRSNLWGVSPESIDTPSAWGLGHSYDRSQGSVIAIIGSGLDTNHPDLVGHLWTNPGELAGNGKDDDRNGVVDDLHGFNAIDGSGNVTDYSGQGTHVAGIIAGSHTVPSTGVADPKSLMQIKFFND